MEGAASPTVDSASQLAPPPSTDGVAAVPSLTSFSLTSVLVDTKDWVALLGTFPPSPSAAVVAIKPPRLTASALLAFLPSTPSTLRHSNSIYHSVTSPLLPCHVDVTYPAPAPLIARLSTPSSPLLVVETAADYAAMHLPYISEQLRDPKHLGWVYNILDGLSEVDRVLLRVDEGEGRCVLVAHPEWDLREGAAGLHAIAIVHDRALHCLRDLTAAHLPLLTSLRASVTVALQQRFGLSESGLSFFLHYVPSYYHLHVHVVRVDVDKGFTSAVNKAVDLFDVEQQLRRDSAYYQHCSIRCRVHAQHPLSALANDSQTQTAAP